MNGKAEEDGARVELKGRKVSSLDKKQSHRQKKNRMPAVREGSSFWTCPACQTSVHTALQTFHLSSCSVLTGEQRHNSRTNAKEEKKRRVLVTGMVVDEQHAGFEEPAMLTTGGKERISKMEVGRSNDDRSERLMPGPETPAQEGRDLNMLHHMQTTSSVSPSPSGKKACGYGSNAVHVVALEDPAVATEVKRQLFTTRDEKWPMDWGEKLPTDSDEEEEEEEEGKEARISNADVLSVSSTGSHLQQGTAISTTYGGQGGAPRQVINLDSEEDDDIAEFAEFETPSEGCGRACNGKGKASPRIINWESLDSDSEKGDDISDADTLPYLGSVRDSQEPESEDPKVKEREEEDENKVEHTKSSPSVSNAGNYFTGREIHKILQNAGMASSDTKPRSSGRSNLNVNEEKMRPYLSGEIEEQEEQSARMVDTREVRNIGIHEKRSCTIQDTRVVASRREAELESELSSLKEDHLTALARIAELEQILVKKNEECQRIHTPQQKDSSIMMHKQEDEVLATQILSQTSATPGLCTDTAKGDASYPNLVVDLEIDKRRPADEPRTNMDNKSTVRRLFSSNVAEAMQPLVQLKDSGSPTAAAMRSGSIVTRTPASVTLKPAAFDAHANGERPGESGKIGEAATTPSLQKGPQTSAGTTVLSASASDGHHGLISERRDEFVGNCRNRGLISNMLDNFPPAQGTESQLAMDPFQIYSVEATQERGEGLIPAPNDLIIIESDEDDEKGTNLDGKDRTVKGLQKMDTGDSLVQQRTPGVSDSSPAKGSEEYVLNHNPPRKKRRKLVLNSESDSDEISGSADQDKNYGVLISDSSTESYYEDDIFADY